MLLTTKGLLYQVNISEQGSRHLSIVVWVCLWQDCISSCACIWKQWSLSITWSWNFWSKVLTLSVLPCHLQSSEFYKLKTHPFSSSFFSVLGSKTVGCFIRDAWEILYSCRSDFFSLTLRAVNWMFIIKTILLILNATFYCFYSWLFQKQLNWEELFVWSQLIGGLLLTELLYLLFLQVWIGIWWDASRCVYYSITFILMYEIWLHLHIWVTCHYLL